MKILLIMGAQGGVARHVIDLAYGLKKIGHEVFIIHNNISNEEIKHNLLLLSSMGVNTKEINFRRNVSTIDILAVLRIYFYIFKVGNFDVIHGHSSKGGFYARLIGIFLRTKIIYTPHAFFSMNSNLNFLQGTFFKKIEFLMSKFTNKIILTSSSEINHAHLIGINSKKIILIPNGIFGSPFNKISKNNIINSKKKYTNLVFVGRLCFQKDPLRAIFIFNSLVNQIPNLRLLMLGTGEYLEDINDLIRKLGLKTKIKIYNKYSLNSLLNIADIMLITSRYEGSAYLFQDSCMASLPIITTNVGGVEFFVNHSRNGYIYNTNDEAKKYILKILLNRQRLQEMSNSSFKAIKRFTLKKMAISTNLCYFSN